MNKEQGMFINLGRYPQIIKNLISPPDKGGVLYIKHLAPKTQGKDQ